MDGLRVVSLNMNGGRGRKKRAVTKQLFEQLDVILLQEKHSDSDNETEWALCTEVSVKLSNIIMGGNLNCTLPFTMDRMSLIQSLPFIEQPGGSSGTL